MDEVEDTFPEAAALTGVTESTDAYVLDRRFTLWLAARPGRPLVPRTRGEYSQRVALFLCWLRGVRVDHPAALVTAEGRDAAVAAFLAHLKSLGRGYSTWNVTLAALNAYYDFLDLEPSRVPPAPIERVITRPLTVSEQSDLIAVAQARPAHTRLFRIRRSRNLALVVLLLYSGLRESEVSGLDDEDVVLTGAQSFVRAPRRLIHLPGRAHYALAEWRAERAALVGDQRIKAFFLAGDHDGDGGRMRRLSRRQIEDIVRELGRETGLRDGSGIAPGVLRATYACRLAAEQPDQVVARQLGQVKPDVPQLDTLRATAPTRHPGRFPEADPPGDSQLSLDF
ncbi:tyrosine-type recombinase/integrase [Nocardia sp. NPDC004860]|uniref:tyrosine-type recombinase/integrase n=1 Tax=Nocardia sp. NPDC004860 TaxID=3154557 RepID=UPI0033B69021